MFFPSFCMFAAFVVPSISASDLKCITEKIAIGGCITTQSLSANCIECGQFLDFDLLTEDCSGIGQICSLKQCCPECEPDATSLGDCMLGSDCDTNCANAPPTTPVPTLPPAVLDSLQPAVGLPTIGSFPTGGGNDVFSNQCDDEVNAMTACLFENLVGCANTCSQDLTDDLGDGDDEVTCDEIEEACGAWGSCCPQCAGAYNNVVNCGARVTGCNERCGSGAFAMSLTTSLAGLVTTAFMLTFAF